MEDVERMEDANEALNQQAEEENETTERQTEGPSAAELQQEGSRTRLESSRFFAWMLVAHPAITLTLGQTRFIGCVLDENDSVYFQWVRGVGKTLITGLLKEYLNR